MPVLQLADHAVFDPTDGAGVIVDNRESVYLGLNEVATLMLQTALRTATEDAAVAELQERIDAPAETLQAGLTRLIGQLDQHGLLAKSPQRPA